MARDPDDLVFSTDGSHRERCPRCGQQPCACPPAAEIVPAQTVLRMRLETKGRRGKAVTVVHGLPPHPDYWAALLKRLKAHCGTGGALKPGAMELQGDQTGKARAWLEGLGFTVRRSGG